MRRRTRPSIALSSLEARLTPAFVGDGGLSSYALGTLPAADQQAIRDSVYTRNTIDIRVANNTLFVTGTPLDDQVDVANESTVNSTNAAQGSKSLAVGTNYSRIEFNGGGGNDTFTTQVLNRAVTARGGDGNDTLSGGPLADVLAGDFGTDTLSGKDGHDIIWGDGVGQVTGTSPDGSSNGSMMGDTIRGDGGNDYLVGGYGTDYVYGDAGHDTVVGGEHDDVLDGGLGNDQVGQQEYSYTTYITILGITIPTGTAVGVSAAEPGNDVLRGGGDNDTLKGGAGTDSLYGDWGNDWLEAGAAWETADGGAGTDWNAHVWAVNGATTTDVDQQQSNTCVILASMAGAAKRVNLADRITYNGMHNYGVRFFDPSSNAWVTQSVRFDGTMVFDGGNAMDPGSVAEGEFWTIVMQRAYLRRFFDIDPMNGAAVAGFGGEGNGRAQQILMGRSVSEEEIDTAWWDVFDSDITPEWLRDMANTRLVCAGGTGHRYMVDSVFQDGAGNWQVRLYNPWGSDATHNSIPFTAVGANDGFINVTWDAFRGGLETVWFTN